MPSSSGKFPDRRIEMRMKWLIAAVMALSVVASAKSVETVAVAR
ncbi:MAG: hypothetical protein ACYTEG_11015 [Planctomycetota bacterium]|jgi:hypothetical protein